MHNERENFIVHGRAESAAESMSKHRIVLAPIKFGAGLKGKFIDAMKTGTPAATTSIGAEAMRGDLPWNGICCDDIHIFSKEAANLYQNKAYWLAARNHGIKIINERYAKALFIPIFIKHIENLQAGLLQHRRKNFIGQILQHHTLNSLKYMSLWIAEKNKA